MQKHVFALSLSLFVALAGATSARAADSPNPTQARAIATQAYIYGYPMVDNYKAIFAYFIDKNNPQYKTGFNTIYNTANVYTPADTTVVTPNSDTPYSFVGMDLTEPLVLTLPAIEKDRYYSVQLIDLYTYNFAYLGSRTTGNGGGHFLIAGPEWTGATPAGITKVIRSETRFAIALYRTQLFGPSDLDNVKKIQAGYKVQQLSVFANRPRPEPPPKINWPTYDPKAVAGIGFFNYLNFLLQLCSVDPSEVQLRQNFAIIGIAPFKTVAMTGPMATALAGGMTDGNAAIDAAVAKAKGSSAQYFGTREFLKNNYLNRAVGAQLGIYGNSAAEATYAFYKLGPDGNQFDASKNNYQLTFAPGKLPPVNAFWSVTMYDGKTQLLVANPLDRYLINSPMLPQLKKNADGGITLYLQATSPGKDLESNWLPAPDGLIYVVMRLYWPKQEVLDGQWTAPPLQASK